MKCTESLIFIHPIFKIIEFAVLFAMIAICLPCALMWFGVCVGIIPNIMFMVREKDHDFPRPGYYRTVTLMSSVLYYAFGIAMIVVVKIFGHIPCEDPAGGQHDTLSMITPTTTINCTYHNNVNSFSAMAWGVASGTFVLYIVQLVSLLTVFISHQVYNLFHSTKKCIRKIKGTYYHSSPVNPGFESDSRNAEELGDRRTENSTETEVHGAETQTRLCSRAVLENHDVLIVENESNLVDEDSETTTVQNVHVPQPFIGDEFDTEDDFSPNSENLPPSYGDVINNLDEEFLSNSESLPPSYTNVINNPESYQTENLASNTWI